VFLFQVTGVLIVALCSVPVAPEKEIKIIGIVLSSLVSCNKLMHALMFKSLGSVGFYSYV